MAKQHRLTTDLSTGELLLAGCLTRLFQMGFIFAVVAGALYLAKVILL